MEKLPALSVIIITKNRRETLSNAIASIISADYPPDLREIIVLEETNTPQPFTNQDIIYKTIPTLDKGFAYARNYALQFASNEIVAFTDDDCIVDKAWLRELVKPFFWDTNIAAVAGAVLVPECGVLGKCENILGFPGGGLSRIYGSDGKIIEIDTFSTCNCAIKKDFINKAGGFYEQLKYGGEDELLSQKIKHFGKIVFTPYAKVYHIPRDSWMQIWKWFLRRGKARWWTNHIKEQNESLYAFLSTSPYLRFALILLLALLVNLWLLPLILFLYYFIVFVRYRWIYKYGHSIKEHLLLPVVRSWMDMAYHLGFTIEALKQMKNKNA